MLDPPCAERQRRRRAERGAEVGEAAGQHVQRQHPERRVRQSARLGAEHRAVRLALAERLQGRQALDRVEELLAERLERVVPPLGRAAGLAMHCRRQEQREQGRAQHDGGDGEVPPGDEEEDGDGRAQSDRRPAANTGRRTFAIARRHRPSTASRRRFVPRRTRRAPEPGPCRTGARAAPPARGSRCCARPWCGRGRARNAARSRRRSPAGRAPGRATTRRGRRRPGSGRGTRTVRSPRTATRGPEARPR